MNIVETSEDKKFNDMLQVLAAAHLDGERAAIVRVSAHLDGVIRHVVRSELSAAEIIELLQVESQKLHDVGLSIGGATC